LKRIRPKIVKRVEDLVPGALQQIGITKSEL